MFGGSLMKGLGTAGKAFGSGFDAIGGMEGLGQGLQGAGSLMNANTNKKFNKDIKQANQFNQNMQKENQDQYNEDRKKRSELRF